MKKSRLLGLGAIIVGVVLLSLAYRSVDTSQSAFGTYLGDYSGQTVAYIIAGLSLCTLGMVLCVFGPGLRD